MQSILYALILLSGFAAHAKTYSVAVTAQTCDEAESQSAVASREQCEKAAPDNQCEQVGESIRGDAEPCEMIVTYIGIQ